MKNKELSRITDDDKFLITGFIKNLKLVAKTAREDALKNGTKAGSSL